MEDRTCRESGSVAGMRIVRRKKRWE
jgi:hypothetical protein